MTLKKIPATKVSPKALARVKPSPKAISKSRVDTKSTVVAGAISMQQVKEVIGLIKDAGHFSTFSYKTPEFEIEIEVGNRAHPEVSAALSPTVVLKPTKASVAPQASAPQTSVVGKLRDPGAYFEVLSPMVGTFYRRPGPTSPPFVEIGTQVNADTPVCIVEVMKLLNTIPAEHAGKIIEICVADGETIEAGQVLMVIEL